MKNILALKINEQSQISETRRLTNYAATAMGFNETDRGRISILVTELAGNLVKHAARGGEFQLYRRGTGEYEGLEILSIDKGPGMTNIAECMRDGYSTAGSPGTGLGSVSRLSDYFEIFSSPAHGTIILSRVWLNKNRHRTPVEDYDFGAVAIPKTGEDVSGDKWAMKYNDRKILIMVSDGLGHGINASEASLEAVKAFDKCESVVLPEVMEAIHLGLKHTRGAAVALTEIDPDKNSVQYCGIGNITSAVVSPDASRSMVSHNGIVGHEVRKIHVFNYPWTHDSLLIMHSDGIGTRWNLDKYPGIIQRSSSIICSVLYRDFQRGNDDVTVLAIKAQNKFQK